MAKDYSYERRWQEKEASRAADEAALAAGVSVEELMAKNCFLSVERTIVHWPKVRRF